MFPPNFTGDHRFVIPHSTRESQSTFSTICVFSLVFHSRSSLTVVVVVTVMKTAAKEKLINKCPAKWEHPPHPFRHIIVHTASDADGFSFGRRGIMLAVATLTGREENRKKNFPLFFACWRMGSLGTRRDGLILVQAKPSSRF